MGVEDLGSIDQFKLGVAAGLYDKQLDTIVAVVQQRRELLRAQHAGETLARIHVGSRVRFNKNTTKNFLNVPATVTDIKDGKIIVDLDYPIQGGRGKRWHTGIICPPSILDVVEPS